MNSIMERRGADLLWVPLLSHACDLGSVGHYASDGVLEWSVFKV
jgi:hypothetical protein